MAWEDEAAAKLTQYRGEEYSNDEQARKCVINAEGVWYAEDMLVTVLTIPERRRDDFDMELAHRLSAVENLQTSVGWSKEMLRKV